MHTFRLLPPGPLLASLLLLPAALLLPACEPTCEPLQDGRWSVQTVWPYGDDLLDRTLEATLTMTSEDERICSFTLTDWAEPDDDLPDSVPTEGIVNIDEVFLHSDDLYWHSCEGEVVEEWQVEGQCFSGAALAMDRVD
ncbi:MAG: hypothetical protein H6742_20450 [Alphaproteobacteria bacterium]|nr:hypothetical protein [Alphaproteobacteria bacterium]